MNRVGKICELVGKQIGVGHSHDGGANRLCQGTPVAEVGVGKMRVPIKIIIDGMVNSSAVFITETHIKRSYAEMIEEDGVVRT